MDLVFKEACDACAKHISYVDLAYVCGQECTWCPECAEGYGMVCPNCSDELRKRPRRTKPVGA